MAYAFFFVKKHFSARDGHIDIDISIFLLISLSYRKMRKLSIFQYDIFGPPVFAIGRQTQLSSVIPGISRFPEKQKLL